MAPFSTPDLVDKFHLFLAPKFIGGSQAPGILGGLGVARLAEAPPARHLSMPFSPRPRYPYYRLP